LILWNCGSGRGEEPSGAKSPPPDSDPFKRRRVWPKLHQLVKKIRRKPDTPLQAQKRSQLFIRSHNETLSVAAMCVCNPDRSPLGIDANTQFLNSLHWADSMQQRITLFASRIRELAIARPMAAE